MHARSVARLIGPPLVAFAAVWALLAALASHEGKPPFETALWMRWDAHLYVLQSKVGPTLEHCGRGSGYDRADWCGTAGWMPLYPLLIRGGAALGLDREVAGVLLSAAFHLATLVLVWWVVRRAGPLRGGLALALAAVFPGLPYAHAVFPISAIQLALTGFVVALALRQFLLAAVAALCVSALHSTGVFVAPMAVVALLASWNTLVPRDRLRALAVPLGAVLGLSAVFLWHHLATGRWNALFLVQAKYGHHPTFPWNGLLGSYTMHGPWSTLQGAAIAAQTTFVLLLVATTLVLAWRHRDDAFTLPVVLVVGAFWLGPLVMGPNVGFYRTEALLIPSVLVLRHASPKVLAPLVMLAIVTSSLIAMVYFRGTLV